MSDEELVIVDGRRVRRVPNTFGTHWVCDCAEFRAATPGARGPWCWHVEVAAVPERYWTVRTREKVRNMKRETAVVLPFRRRRSGRI